MKDNNKYIERHGKKAYLAERAGHGRDVDTPGETNPGGCYAGMTGDDDYGPATGISKPDAGPEPAKK